MRHIAWTLAVLLAASGLAVAGEAPRPTILELRSFFYGDNTEFLGNPYRDGETLLGAQVRLDAAVPIGKASRLRLGVQTDSRAGDTDAFRKVWPVIALEVGGPRDTFIFGTLKSGAFGRETFAGLWPDESGPHGLAPPLQLDTLSMTRPYEAGLQWQRNGDAWWHDIWIAWQQLNTPGHRERFDAGINAVGRVYRACGGDISLLWQAHVVHEGGQLYHTGSVGDSVAGGPGVRISYTVAGGTLRTELLALFSRHNPSREDTARVDHLDGDGRLLRASYERGDWRVGYLRWHAAWRFAKWEGDPNYGVLLNDDLTPYLAATQEKRFYDEFSVSRRFGIGKDAFLVANGRLYHMDASSWDYAYRVAAQVRIRRLFGGKRVSK